MTDPSKRQEVIAVMAAIIYAGTIHEPKDLSEPGDIVDVAIQRAQSMLESIEKRVPAPRTMPSA